MQFLRAVGDADENAGLGREWSKRAGAIAPIIELVLADCAGLCHGGGTSDYEMRPGSKNLYELKIHDS